MMLESPDGTKTTLEVSSGTVYSRDAGIHHNVINVSEQKMSFIEIELKNSSVVSKP